MDTNKQTHKRIEIVVLTLPSPPFHLSSQNSHHPHHQIPHPPLHQFLPHLMETTISTMNGLKHNKAMKDKMSSESGGGVAISGGSTKKGGGAAAGASSVKSCQVEKCSVDLSDAKTYHRRHKVCEQHAKAQAVVVAGIRQRFCQQCSRFHELLEFDESKRSCRRRLAGHNERRRKNPMDNNTQAAEGSSSRIKGTQLKDIIVCDDRKRVQENPNFKHFNLI